jgi:hypothetical protein
VLCRPDKLGWSNMSKNCSGKDEAEIGLFLKLVAEGEKKVVTFSYRTRKRISHLFQRCCLNFENLLCGSLRISASPVFKLPLTQRTLRYAEDAEKTF